MNVSTNVLHEATSESTHTGESTDATDSLDSSRQVDGWASVAGAAAYLGDLPSHSIIRAYEAVHPGTAEWLLRMAEQRIQQRRRQALDASAESYRRKRLVTWLLFGTTLAVLAAAMILSAKGHPEAAIGMAGGWTSVVAVAACLGYLRRLDLSAWSRRAIRDMALKQRLRGEPDSQRRVAADRRPY